MQQCNSTPYSILAGIKNAHCSALCAVQCARTGYIVECTTQHSIFYVDQSMKNG